MNTAEYWAMIKSVSEGILEEAGDDTDSREDLLYEAAGSGVIYTADCMDIILFSPNEDAYFEEFGKLQASDFSEMVTKIAHAALLRDLRNALSETKV